jgi:hypothetical protein
MHMTTRQLMINGSAVRLGYGLMSLFAPDTLFKLSGKAVEAEPRYFNALFGGRDLTVVGATAAALRAGREKDAVLLNMSCEATDLVAMIMEARARGGLDQTLIAAIGFNAFGWATWLSAYRQLA